MIILLVFIPSILMLAWFLAINERQSKILVELTKLANPNIQEVNRLFNSLLSETDPAQRSKSKELVAYHLGKIPIVDKAIKRWVKQKKDELSKLN